MRGTTWKMVLSMVAAGALLAGCGGPLKYAVKGTPKAPEIDAKIVAEVKSDAAMTTLHITAEHIAPPDRLAAGGKVFVVWTKGEKPKWHRVGALKYEEGDRKASIEGASVPVTAFDLQVTVERDAAPDLPSSDVVISQHVN
ncbi:Hypothetical protein A7982_06769 [Minicystis rosea]|nr:Hypothetical protein A7982_06769 [Minicystis rosea]